MADKMLIDASHPEETRVVVVRGNRIEEFDFESQHKKQLRGNIYLAKVTRVEPSLQAAFVDYGGNRHGFLAFTEIHPDYYQIPLADRQALLQAEAEDARNDPDFESADSDDNGNRAKPARDESADDESAGSTAKGKSRPRRSRRGRKAAGTVTATDDSGADEAAEAGDDNPETGDTNDADTGEEASAGAAPADDAASSSDDDDHAASQDEAGDTTPDRMDAAVDADEVSEEVVAGRGGKGDDSDDDDDDDDDHGNGDADDSIEQVGSEDALEEVPARAQRKPRKQYRIQEVIKRRQILLVQVVKEERGNKGAALTTYLSLAGRYSVLMPNTARGGGISRKITNVQDRKRLKEVARELEVPQGMGVILRTAGANRTKTEIKRDFEYLMRLWDTVRSLTLKSTAPCLVYEEGSLIKRSIRDLYNKDISEVIVSGEEGYREAKDFMKMLMPSHAKVVQPYRDLHPIFSRNGIEAQLDRMLQPQVTLKSGGYIIINQTEALVAIDVNSGRSTREHSIEDTALQTNLEAADEVARQLRLRDLAGLIVIDFIDMEENRNNRAVEKRLKDCLKNDRARIQVGRISHFGLMEMSRQRIRASVLESTTQVCSHCGGTGHVRSPSSIALHVLRGIEEYLLKNTTHNITVRTTGDTALYMLNNKRDTIMELERRFGLSIAFAADRSVGAQHFAIDRGAAVEKPVSIEHITASGPVYAEDDDEPVIVMDDEDEAEEAAASSDAASGDEKGDRPQDRDGRKRRRRRRRGRRDGQESGQSANGEGSDAENGDDGDDDGTEADDASSNGEAVSATGDGDETRRKRRRRGKRGGRRNREDETTSDNADGGETMGAVAEEAADSNEDGSGADPVPQTADMKTDAVDAPDGAEDAPAEKKKPARRRRTKASAKSEDEAVAQGAASEDTAEAEGESAAVASHSEESAAETDAAETPSNTEDAGDAPVDRSARTNLDSIASEPVVTSSNGEEKPKKSGWWSKRGGPSFF